MSLLFFRFDCFKAEVGDKSRFPQLSIVKAVSGCTDGENGRLSYQAFYNRAPPGISSLLTKHSPLRNLRDSLKLHVQRPKSDFLRSSFSHRVSILWNKLPMYLKSKPNVSFKSALKAKSDIVDKITFNGIQGINKDIVNYVY